MAITSEDLVTSGNGRVWIQPGGPSSPFLYGACFGIGDVTAPEGDLTPVFCPSRTVPNEWDVKGQLRGTPGNKTTSLEAPLDAVNYLLRLKCEFNAQYRITSCGTPEDPDSWENLIHFRGMRITSRGLTGLNPRTPDNNGEILTTADVAFLEFIDVKRMEFVTSNVIPSSTSDFLAVSFCDEPSCPGNCGEGSDGCQVGFAVFNNGIYKTTDGGGNWSEITSPFVAIYDDVVDVACKGDVVIIVNGTTAGRVARSQDGGETWSIVTLPDNIVANAVYMVDVSRVYVAGADGYVWYSQDGGRTFVTQTDGAATSEDLKDIFFFDNNRGWAVGANGAIIRTVDGASWVAITSGVATQLNAVHFITAQVGFAAGASGTLLKSVDGGATWTVETWFGAGTDTINAITSCEQSFVFFGGTTSAPAGFLYMSIDGGDTASAVTLESIAGINDLHCCAPDLVYAAGDNGDIVKGS